MTVDGPRVVADLEAWRRQLETGKFRFRGLFQPKLEPGERAAAAIILRVHHENDVAGREPGDRDLGPFGAGLQPGVEGAAKVTSRRLILAGNGRRIIETWWWRDVEAVRVLHPVVGIEIHRRDGQVDLAGNVWHSTIPGGRPDSHELVVRWLEVEATFTASLHPAGLDGWFAQLPSRFAGMD